LVDYEARLRKFDLVVREGDGGGGGGASGEELITLVWVLFWMVLIFLMMRKESQTRSTDRGGLVSSILAVEDDARDPGIYKVAREERIASLST